MKKCIKCNQDKELKEFSKDKKQKDGYYYYCIKCKNQYHKKHYGNRYQDVYAKKAGYGIYKIIHKDTKECYIGKGWINERKVDHFAKLKAQKHTNRYFQALYNKNNNFEFIILEKCNESEGSLKEREYLMKYFLENPNLLLNQHITIRWQ